ncbi:putative prefoldin subunit, partial [Tribonema minus]
LTEQQVISHYKQLLGDCSAIRRKIAELEQESTEHELVMETLEKVEEKTKRRAFRLVGGVLVERTVADVLPSVQANHAGIKQVLGHLATDLRAKEEAAAAWKIKYSIRTQDELQAGAAAQ